MIELPIVAWMDDGQQAANGTEGTTFRVVTERTKASMPRAAVGAYTDALVRKSDALAYAARVRAEALEEAMRAVLHEVLHLEEVNCEEDVAYNTAISHAHKAIRALIEGDGSIREADHG